MNDYSKPLQTNQAFMTELFRGAFRGDLRSILFLLFALLIAVYPLLRTEAGIALFTLVIIVYIVYLIKDKPGRQRFMAGVKDTKSITTMALLFITLWTILSAAASFSPLETLGYSVLVIYLFLFFILLKYEFPQGKYREGFYGAYFLGLFLVMGYLMIQNLGTLIEHGQFIRGTHLATIENANSLAIFAMTGFFTALFKAREAKTRASRSFFILLTAITMAGILLAQSRAVLVTMFIGFFILIVRYNKKFIWSLLLFAALIILLPSVQQRFLDIFSYEQNVPRVKIWITAVKLAQMNPLTGTGANVFRFGYGEYFKTHPELFNNWDIKEIWHAHNMFLRFLAELGIPGLLGILGVIWGSFRGVFAIMTSRVYRASRSKFADGIFIALVSFYLANLMDSYFMEPKIMLVFYVFLGVSQAYSQNHQLVT